MTNDKNQPTVSMMKFRSQPGTILDEVYYRNRNVIIEKAGKPRAALVSMQDYLQVQRMRQEVKSDLSLFIDEIQRRTAKYKKKEVQQAIDEAVRAVKDAYPETI